jgi:hypothetical protein
MNLNLAGWWEEYKEKETFPVYVRSLPADFDTFISLCETVWYAQIRSGLRVPVSDGPAFVKYPNQLFAYVSDGLRFNTVNVVRSVPPIDEFDYETVQMRDTIDIKVDLVAMASLVKATARRVGVDQPLMVAVPVFRWNQERSVGIDWYAEDCQPDGEYATGKIESWTDKKETRITGDCSKNFTLENQAMVFRGVIQ